YHRARRQVRDPHRRVGRVDALAARARRAVDVDLEVVVAQLDVDILGLRHHCDGCGRGVDPPLRLRRRDALDTVGAPLPLEDRVGAVALDGEADALEAAGRVRARLQLPPLDTRGS